MLFDPCSPQGADATEPAGAHLTALVQEAAWYGRTHELCSRPQVDARSWAGSVQRDCRSFGVDVALDVPRAAGAAEPRVAAVMMVKDEADIVGANLAWLYQNGLRRFVVLDNGSADGTVQVLNTFRHARRDVELIVVDDPRLSYAQGMRTTGLMRLAVTLWPDLHWTFALDADEFLMPSRGFGPLLDLTGDIDAITMPKVIHYRSRALGEMVDADPFSSMPLRSKPFLLPPKVACRSHVHRGVTDGNHFAQLLDGRTPQYESGLALGLYIREFQTRSYTQLRRKVVNGAAAIRATHADGTGQGGEHWLALFSILQQGGDAALVAYYERDCVLEAGPTLLEDRFAGPA